MGETRRWMVWGFVVLLAARWWTVGCGSAAEAPTLSIPAPIVTKITIGNPEGGLSTITGAAGAVTGGNLVSAQNLTQEGITSRWERLFWGIAYAATTVQTTAAADGSFSLQIEASLGDRIRITQRDAAGSTSTAAEMVAPYQPLTLAFTPTGIAVDPDSDTAYIIGTSGDDGVVAPLTFGATPTLGNTSTLLSACNRPTAVAVDGTRNRLIVVDHTNRTVCDHPQNGDPATLAASLTVAPLNIAIDVSGDVAVITNDTAAADVEVSLLDLTTDAFVPVTLPNPVGGTLQSSTPVVATGQVNGTNYAVVVTTYANNDHYGFLINLDTEVVLGTGTALSLTAPGEARVFNNNSVLLSDAGGVARIYVIDEASGVATLTNTLTVGTSPRGVAVDTARRRGYVANLGSATVSRLDLNTSPETVTNTIDVATEPIHLAFRGGTTNQLAIVHQDGTLIVLGE
ncbi:MAG: hypothetical protein HY696_07135 [Deltaproteobacteria bacterium]|nr:hypothetical protein [Deltaproteobacteria bacterium]